MALAAGHLVMMMRTRLPVHGVGGADSWRLGTTARMRAAIGRGAERPGVLIGRLARAWAPTSGGPRTCGGRLLFRWSRAESPGATRERMADCLDVQAPEPEPFPTTDDGGPSPMPGPLSRCPVAVSGDPVTGRPLPVTDSDGSRTRCIAIRRIWFRRGRLIPTVRTRRAAQKDQRKRPPIVIRSADGPLGTAARRRDRRR